MKKEKTHFFPMNPEHCLEYRCFFHPGAEKNTALVFMADTEKDFSSFDNQTEYFNDFNIIVIWGLTRNSFREASPREFADQVSSILAETGCRNIHLTGVGTGAFLAQYYASQHPETIRSLACVSGKPLSLYRFYRTEKVRNFDTEYICHNPDLVIDEEAAVRSIPVPRTFKLGIFSTEEKDSLMKIWNNTENHSQLFTFEKKDSEINEAVPDEFNRCLKSLILS